MPRKRINIAHELTVKELAVLLDLNDTEVIKHLYDKMKIMRTINQIVEIDIAKQLAVDMGFDVNS